MNRVSQCHADHAATPGVGAGIHRPFTGNLYALNPMMAVELAVGLGTYLPVPELWVSPFSKLGPLSSVDDTLTAPIGVWEIRVPGTLC